MAEKKWEVFSEVPISAIEPRGHLASFLHEQASGLTGNIAVAGFPFDTHAWAGESISHQNGSAWWPYEQTAYWVDGVTRLASLIENSELSERAATQAEYVLEHADADGYLGPRGLKKPMIAGRWSHAVYFRALMARYSATGEASIPEAIARHYLDSPYDHATHREVCNVEIMCWAYGITGEKALLVLAEDTWQRWLESAEGPDADLSTEAIFADRPVDHTHGVTYLETTKLGAILYLYTGRREYLEYSIAAMDKLEKYHLLPDGGPSSSEDLRGTSSLDAHELCDLADYSWALGYLLMATGKVKYADAIEKIAYNAFPSQVTKDFHQHQYFSSPNQVVLERNSGHTMHAAGKQWMCFRPKPGTECCTGQVNRVLPNFCSRMYLINSEGPVIAAYGDSHFDFQIRGKEGSIAQETAYPFSDIIDISIKKAPGVEFAISVRIPEWCDSASIMLNGEETGIPCPAGSFIPVRSTFKDGDRLRIRLPMKISVSSWPDNGRCIERGPLLYALPIDAKIRVDQRDPYQSPDFPAFNMRPGSSWNYALELDERDPERSLRFETDLPEAEYSAQDGHKLTDPWQNPPVRILASGRRLRKWKINKTRTIHGHKAVLIDPDRNIWEVHDGDIQGKFVLTPGLPDSGQIPGQLSGPLTTLTLVPVGSTLLRISMFPVFAN